MKVALISNIFNPTKLSTPGGLEVFNAFLAKELSRLKVDVKLYAAGDSEKTKYLVPIVPKSLLFSKNAKFSKVPWNYRRITVEEFAVFTDLIQKLIKESCILHFSSVNFLPVYLAAKNKRHSIWTLHMPVTNYHFQAILKLLTSEELKYVHFVGVSKSQIKDFPAKTDVIYDSVDTEAFTYNDRGREAFGWLGRMIPEKGANDAIVAAKKANVELEIAGKPIAENENQFYKEKIKPHLDRKIRSVGFVSGKERNKFYGTRAFMFTPKWDEAFGLTMIEALSCGTPVIAYDRGAIREVIEDGVNGFIVKPDDIAGLAKAMEKINKLDKQSYLKMRKNCRQLAEKKFSLKIMAQEYIKLYKKYGL